jgi:hypothetical protein
VSIGITDVAAGFPTATTPKPTRNSTDCYPVAGGTRVHALYLKSSGTIVAPLDEVPQHTTSPVVRSPQE